MSMWSSQVITRLRVEKDRGASFEEAWARTLAAHPPRGIGMGQAQLSLVDDQEHMPDFLKRVCDDAWHNRRPELMHLSTDLLDVKETVVVGRAA